MSLFLEFKTRSQLCGADRFIIISLAAETAFFPALTRRICFVIANAQGSSLLVGVSAVA